MNTSWLEVDRGEAPLVISFPHTGIDIPRQLEGGFISPWLARKDADWWIDQLYGFARTLGATTVRTRISRSVIDVNRDPSGAALYPGKATTELCPTTTFDGEALYRPGREPDAAEIERRLKTWFTPYHEALDAELKRLRVKHRRVVLYEAHSIRSAIPRLFDGELPQFNIGTNDGGACHPVLTAAVEGVCDATRWTRITNGRFKGGWTTRRCGDPKGGVHAIQMELACRGYLDEPFTNPTPENWPPAYQADRAQPMAEALSDVLKACLTFAKT